MSGDPVEQAGEVRGTGSETSGSDGSPEDVGRAAGGDSSPPADDQPASDDATAGEGRDAEDLDAEDLAAQVELLAAENRRLREEYVRARRTTHRRTAFGLFAVGALAVLGALAVPDARDVLFALGGTGLFGAVLTYYLTPERFVAAGTGERVYGALAATGRELVDELGLRDDRVYAPARPADDTFAGVRLFVPQRADYAVPGPDRLDSLFVVDGAGERGVALPPTGGALYREFETAMADEVRSEPPGLATQLADALVEGFEVVDSARADADPGDGRITVAVAGSVYGPVDAFDHPVASFLAVGLAANLDCPVTAEVTGAAGGAADYFVTCEWDPNAVEYGPAPGAGSEPGAESATEDESATETDATEAESGTETDATGAESETADE